MQPDYLSRRRYLDLIKSIIASQKDNPTGYSFAIDGEWGSGKTWILTELEKQLLEEKENTYLLPKEIHRLCLWCGEFTINPRKNASENPPRALPGQKKSRACGEEENTRGKGLKGRAFWRESLLDGADRDSFYDAP